jgi:hypothetical protein
MCSFFSGLCHSPILRRAAVTLVALAWTTLAFGGEIHDAAKSGDLEKVKTLLKDNPGLVSSQDTNGMSLLDLSSQYGHKEVMALLLSNKADVNATNNKGMTALHYAAIYGQKEIAELLLADGANVDAKDNDGQTPLHDAAVNDHTNLAELLFANKAEINVQDNNGWTPLHLAVWQRHKDVVELLLAENADINALSHKYGVTPLWFADDFYLGNQSDEKRKIVEYLVAKSLTKNDGEHGKVGNVPLVGDIREAIANAMKEHGMEKTAVRLFKVSFTSNTNTEVKVLCDAAVYDRVAMYDIVSASGRLMQVPSDTKAYTHIGPGSAKQFFLLKQNQDGQWVATASQSGDNTNTTTPPH